MPACCATVGQHGESCRYISVFSARLSIQPWFFHDIPTVTANADKVLVEATVPSHRACCTFRFVFRRVIQLNYPIDLSGNRSTYCSYHQCIIFGASVTLNPATPCRIPKLMLKLRPVASPINEYPRQLRAMPSLVPTRAWNAPSNPLSASLVSTTINFPADVCVCNGPLGALVLGVRNADTLWCIRGSSSMTLSRMEFPARMEQMASACNSHESRVLLG